MRVVPFTAVETLTPWARAWDQLAGDNVFRRFAWQATWWKAYGAAATRGLRTLVAFDDAGRVAGVAPWYVQRSPRFGNVLRMLGDGEVCSDYLGLPVRPECAEPFACAIADWLAQQHQGQAAPPATPWNVLDLQGLTADDPGSRALLQVLGARGYQVIPRPVTRCWRLNLPATWSEYEALLSPSHRKQVRRLVRRYLDTGRAVLTTVASATELRIALPALMELHAERRGTFGGQGCFARPAFQEFHRQVAPQLLEQGLLRLHLLELDRRTIAAEYHFGRGTIYAYQAGISPTALADQPGKLATLATIAQAIQEGHTAYDFLRGDEPYKAHFRAAPVELVNVRVVADTPAARWRYRLGSVGESVKDWLRNHLHAPHADVSPT